MCNEIYEALSLMNYECNDIYEALSLMNYICGTGQECLTLSIMKDILCTQVQKEVKKHPPGATYTRWYALTQEPCKSVSMQPWQQ